MVRIFCMLLVVFLLSACGGQPSSAEPAQIPSQEVSAKPQADAAGQPDQAPSPEEFPESETTEGTEPDQQETQAAEAVAQTPAPEEPPVTQQPGAAQAETPADQGKEPPTPQESGEAPGPQAADPGQEEPALKITVGDHELLATFEDNSSAEEFQALLAQGPLTIDMEDYGGFEKVGPLGTTLTRNDTQITTQPGDVILYQGNQITIYYDTNSWSFTRLARIDDPSGLQEKLGDGTVQVTFSLA